MTSRARLFASTTLLGIVGLFSSHADAGLIGVGGTVQVGYDEGVTPSVALEPDGQGTPLPAPLTAPVDFTNNIALTDVHVGDFQIILTNQSVFPFCISAPLSGT